MVQPLTHFTHEDTEAQRSYLPKVTQLRSGRLLIEPTRTCTVALRTTFLLLV